MNKMFYANTGNEQVLEMLMDIKSSIENPQEDPSQIWLDSQEVMEWLHISQRTLIKYRQEGILKYSRIGKKIYYRKSDILELLERNIQKEAKQ